MYRVIEKTDLINPINGEYQGTRVTIICDDPYTIIQRSIPTNLSGKLDGEIIKDVLDVLRLEINPSDDILQNKNEISKLIEEFKKIKEETIQEVKKSIKDHEEMMKITTAILNEVLEELTSNLEAEEEFSEEETPDEIEKEEREVKIENDSIDEKNSDEEGRKNEQEN